MNHLSALQKRPKRAFTSPPELISWIACLVWLSSLTTCTFNLPKCPSGSGPKSEAIYAADAFQRVLTRFVDEDGRVDYQQLHNSRADLDTYVGLISRVGPKTHPDLFKTREDALAYYINAYNAYVLWHVVELGPDIESVGAHQLAQMYFFILRFFRLDGELTNLWMLENETIRPEFSEPRIHFALNCASLGCPKLPQTIFRGPELETQLEQETTRFLNEKRNLHVDGNRVILSQVFEWFPEDFQPSVSEWLRQRPETQAWPDNPQLTYRTWDWALNHRIPKTTKRRDSPPLHQDAGSAISPKGQP
jgi:hypothetical protein